MVLVILLWWPQFTWASEVPPSVYARPGVYAGFGGVYAIDMFTNTHGVMFKNGPGFNFRLGYRFSSIVSGEVEGERIEEFSARGSMDGVKTWVTTVNIKFHLLQGRIQPFVISGLGILHAATQGQPLRSDARQNAPVGRVAIGIDFYLTKHWVMNCAVAAILPYSGGFHGPTEFGYAASGAGLQVRW